MVERRGSLRPLARNPACATALAPRETDRWPQHGIRAHPWRSHPWRRLSQLAPILRRVLCPRISAGSDRDRVSQLVFAFASRRATSSLCAGATSEMIPALTKPTTFISLGIGTINLSLIISTIMHAVPASLPQSSKLLRTACSTLASRSTPWSSGRPNTTSANAGKKHWSPALRARRRRRRPAARPREARRSPPDESTSVAYGAGSCAPATSPPGPACRRGSRGCRRRCRGNRSRSSGG